MGVFQNNLLAGAAAAASAGGGGFYSYQIEQSARFDRASSSHLNITQGTPTNVKKGTFSFWLKRGAISQTTQVLFTYDGGGINTLFESTDIFDFTVNNASSGAESQPSSGVFRDTGGWVHVVFAVDTSQGTASNRMKVYFNGTQDTGISGSGVNADSNFSYNKDGQVLYFGRNTGASIDYDGYLAEFIFADGQQYEPTQFGETKNGVWIPKDPTGTTFGNNGFHLKFENASDLGNDSSGNNNDFTVNNMGADHQVLDSPTFGS